MIATIRSQGGSQRSDLVPKRFHATKTHSGLNAVNGLPAADVIQFAALT